MGFRAEPPQGLWGGKGCGGGGQRPRTPGRACTVTQAGQEGGFEEVTRGGERVAAAESGTAKAMSTPHGVGAAAVG